jgi:cytosine deaminase
MSDPAAVGLHLQLGRAHGIDLQLVAFPQNGITGPGDVRLRMERALDDGCTVVGGCPYADNDPERHLSFITSLAADRGLPLDLHADLSDDPGQSQLEMIVRHVERAGLQGRVALGHLTTLATMPHSDKKAAIASLAQAGIAVIGLPTTDLWLSGRSREHGRSRGLVPIPSLYEAGVPLSLASNNHQNAFTPVGSGGLLRIAWLAALVAQIGDPVGHAMLFDSVCSTPAQLLGLGRWGVQPGSCAPLLLLDSEDPLDAVREAPRVMGRISDLASSDAKSAT